jgi:hypothetical protein
MTLNKEPVLFRSAQAFKEQVSIFPKTHITRILFSDIVHVPPWVADISYHPQPKISIKMNKRPTPCFSKVGLFCESCTAASDRMVKVS